MTRDRSDEFFVGYLDQTPLGVARFTRRAAVGFLLLAAALGAGLALLLEQFDEGVFEYGLVRAWEGKMLVDPHPRLLTVDGPAAGYLLVAEGKHGLDLNSESDSPWSPSFSSRTALSGTLIENPEAAMLEVHSIELPEAGTAAEPSAGTVSRHDGGGDSAPDGSGDGSAAAAAPDGAETDRRHVRANTVVGEIVDTKCYLGAMKPGRGKPHRDCAALCIRGGIPAALLVRTTTGERELLHLVDLAGRPLGRELLDRVGQPVEVTGQLRRMDDRLFLALSDTRGIRAATGTGS